MHAFLNHYCVYLLALWQIV